MTVRSTDYPGARCVRALADRRARPDPRWVERLTGASSSAVERTFRETDRLVAIEEAIHTRHLAGGRSFYAQIQAPLELYALTRLLRPEQIVEAGVSSGVSSAHFLLGLRANRRGRLRSIDKPVPQRRPKLAEGETSVAVPPGKGSGWAVPPELRRRWDLRLGLTQEILPALVRRLDRVDLFLHDDLHTPAHLTFELETIRPKLRPGSVVLADNTEWTGTAFDRFAKSLGVPKVRRRRSGLVGLRVPD